MVSGEKKENTGLSPNGSPKFIYLSNHHAVFENLVCAALCQGLWREERYRKGSAEEIETIALLRPLPIHLLSPIESPALLWGLGPEWKDRRESRKQKPTVPALQMDALGFACRHLALRLPNSYLQGEAVHR